MADAYTETTSLDFSQKAYNRRAAFALRPRLMFDQLADVWATDQSMPGVSVQFNIFGDLAIQSTPLVENQDVALIAPTDSTVTATLNEYGAAMASTRALQGTSFIPIDPALANLIGFNAGVSIDEVSKNIAQGGTNVYYPAANGHTQRIAITTTDIITANDVRLARTFLARNNAMTWISGQGGGAPGAGTEDGDFDSLLTNPGTGWYAAMIHPDVAYDLRGQTGSGAWRIPSEYAAGFGNPGHSGVWSGELGAFENFRFVENSRAPYFVNGGSSSTNVYGTLFMGSEAMLKIWARTMYNGPRPGIIVGPVTDRLRRFNPIGWYWFGAYAIYRQNCLYRLVSASTPGGTTTGGDDPTIDL